MKEKISICIVDYYDSAKFFLRLASADSLRNHVFITTSFVAYALIKKSGFEVLLISRFAKSKNINIEHSNTKEFKLGILSQTECSALAGRISYSIERIILNHKDKSIVLLTWNGTSVIGEVMRYFKLNKSNVATLFFEVANIKGKIFVDTVGVNAASSLFFTPEKLDDYDFNDLEFESWRRNFICSKLDNISLPPQSVKIRSINARHVVDFIFLSLLGYKTFPKGLVKNKILSKLKIQKTTSSVDEIDSTNSMDYIFFPMQLSSDTQIALNSDVGNIEALAKVISQESLPIIVKPHPAEINFGYLLDFIKNNGDRVKISFDNTYHLLNSSKKVYVINSTLGLEAMLFEKEVEFLGKSFFPCLTGNRLGKYIMSYLISADFFENSELNQAQAQEIYSMQNGM
jgi:capsular polysaccharide export protein